MSTDPRMVREALVAAIEDLWNRQGADFTERGDKALVLVADLCDQLEAAHRRHTRYLDDMEKVLGPIRERRSTGEPALSDWREVARLVSRLEAAEQRAGYIRALAEGGET